MAVPPPDPPPQRRDNGLLADRYVALADVDPRLGDHLLDLLRLADIPAYLEPPGDPRTTARYATPGPVERLFVQAALKSAAREVVMAAAAEAGGPDRPQPSASDRGTWSRDASARDAGADALSSMDTDAEFARIVAGFDDPPPVANRPDIDPISAAMLDAAAEQRASIERDRVAAADRDVPDEHYEPPPPPPFPIPSAATISATLLAMFGLFLIARGDLIGFTPDAAFPLGVVALLSGLGLLVARLRSRGVEDDGDDDGAVV